MIESRLADVGDMSQLQHCVGCDGYKIPEFVTETPLTDESIYICPDCVRDEKKMAEIGRKYGLGEFVKRD